MTSEPQLGLSQHKEIPKGLVSLLLSLLAPKRGSAKMTTPCPTSGCGSKMGTQNGTMVNGNMD